MRFSTDDGSFGIVLTPSHDSLESGLFYFRLILDRVVVGKGGPDLIYSTMRQLACPPAVSDSRVPRLRRDPPRLWALIRSMASADPRTLSDEDVDLYDRTMLQAEALDHWGVRQLKVDGDVITMAQAVEGTGSSHLPSKPRGPLLSTVVPVEHHQEIVNAAVAFWLARTSLKMSRSWTADRLA